MPKEMPKNAFLLIIVIVVLTASASAWWLFGAHSGASITSFEECAKAGYPILEIYPEQCRAPDGQLFTRSINSDGTEFGSPVTLHLNEQSKFKDGLTVTLVGINDSRCKSGVVCVWAGELAFQFKLLGGNIDQDTEIKLGTITAESVMQGDYTFALKEATENASTIIVTKESGAGILPFKSGVTGKVLLGPTCPVMQNPPDPNCADRGYVTTVQVVQKNSTKNSLFASVETDKEGNYKVMLPPGEYSLQALGGKTFPSCSWSDVTIEPDVLLNVDLSCDTGIR